MQKFLHCAPGLGLCCKADVVSFEEIHNCILWQQLTLQWTGISADFRRAEFTQLPFMEDQLKHESSRHIIINWVGRRPLDSIWFADDRTTRYLDHFVRSLLIWSAGQDLLLYPYHEIPILSRQYQSAPQWKKFTSVSKTCSGWPTTRSAFFDRLGQIEPAAIRKNLRSVSTGTDSRLVFYDWKSLGFHTAGSALCLDLVASTDPISIDLKAWWSLVCCYALEWDVHTLYTIPLYAWVS